MYQGGPKCVTVRVRECGSHYSKETRNPRRIWVDDINDAI